MILSSSCFIIWYCRIKVNNNTLLLLPNITCHLCLIILISITNLFTRATTNIINLFTKINTQPHIFPVKTINATLNCLKPNTSHHLFRSTWLACSPSPEAMSWYKSSRTQTQNYHLDNFRSSYMFILFSHRQLVLRNSVTNVEHST